MLGLSFFVCVFAVDIGCVGVWYDVAIGFV